MAPAGPHRPRGIGAHSTLSRRSFLAAVAALGAGAALGSSGCAGTSSLRAADLSSGKDGRLRIDNWESYIDPDDGSSIGTVRRFAEASGVNVTYEDKYTNAAALAPTGPLGSLQTTGFSGYDLLVPTYWVVERLLRKQLLQPIPVERVPNHANLLPELMTTPWDRGARFNLPWQSGFTGIAWNPAETNGKEIRSVDQLLHDTTIKGRVGLVVEMREVIGLIMLGKGQDPSRPTVEQAGAALDDLEDVLKAGQIKFFTATEFQKLLPDRTLAACLAWSGGFVQIQGANPGLRFTIPNEGGIRWFDSMIIPVDAANPRAAADFMNFVYTPAQAARITMFVQYISPVIGVQAELRRMGGPATAVADNPILFPDEETRRRLYFWPGLGEGPEATLQARFDALTAPYVYK
jgi:spermidine/putrescine transport system substrate-binding protein